MKKIISLLFLAMLFSSNSFCQIDTLIAIDTSSLVKEESMEDTIPPKKKSSKTLYGIASFYSDYFNGRKTANGEIFSQRKMTCACNQLPLGTWIKVTCIKNNKSIVVKVNDRLHPRMKRIVDLTRAGAEKLGFVGAGLTKVKVEVIGKKLK